MRRAGGGGPNSRRGDEDERADERLKTSQFSTFRTAMASGHLPPRGTRDRLHHPAQFSHALLTRRARL